MTAGQAARDPWLATNATTTTGNNVDAFADIAPPAGFGPGDIRPEVKSSRVLNYVYDPTAGPLSSVTQSKASQRVLRDQLAARLVLRLGVHRGDRQRADR